MSSLSPEAKRGLAVSQIISDQVIRMDKLSKECRGGLPDRMLMRQLVWKLLLEYIPSAKSDWQEVLSRMRKEYSSFCEFTKVAEITSEGGREYEREEDGKKITVKRIHDFDGNPAFNADDLLLLEQIDKDVRRTYPDMHFFATDNEPGCIPLEAPLGQHALALRRILYVFAKFNKGLQYVQGMNEIVAPIYYVFFSDAPADWSEHAEADAFWCFSNLMGGDIGNLYCKSFDRERAGINFHMDDIFKNILAVKDKQVYEYLVSQELLPQFFCLRWVTLLFSQEFALPEVLRIWDSIFAEKDKLKFVKYFCTAMIINVRNEILSSDFATNLKMLQKYPPMDVNIILKKTYELLEPPRRFSIAAMRARLPSGLFRNRTMSSMGGFKGEGN
eukprot:CAMPEP_0113905660 /NCGR_PEP_ID=MMETSP0780_2-20120614/24186_1 /TAXON_ID=652834 /ORGANISM="Palpitomonas bilix" /LENGTH=386 /DNA_ID=CAMNT_0000899915 /DNA_START=238 /DNA_END=1398 /DNA_ORIENTATION=+ /assembly_acc=CAM_ASM_000599